MFNKIKVYTLNGIINDDEIVEISNNHKSIFMGYWSDVPANIRIDYCSNISINSGIISMKVEDKLYD
nr:MAG TPA: hypothetical protein [Caudoviricetes sp.]